MSPHIVLTQESFQSEVLDVNGLVMVFFLAEWSGACHIMEPLVREMSGKFEGRMKVGDLNVDEIPALSTHYGIRTVPTFLFFKGGEQVGQIIGAVSRKELAQTISGLL